MKNGFIGTLLVIVVALVLLKYFFDFSLLEFLKSDRGREVLEYLKSILDYMKDIAIRVWNYIQ